MAKYRIEYRLKYERESTVIDSVDKSDIEYLSNMIVIKNIPGRDKPLLLRNSTRMLYSETLIKE